MKTTLDLPDMLVREMKIRAARDGRKLKDVAAEIIQLGLEQPVTPARSMGKRRVRFPIIDCGSANAPVKDVTPEEQANILVEQEAEWSHDIARR